ncbi:MAG: hypothetical protein HWE25_03390 [Alphaproteobacteria bacterium]|nr:hypothetical protein [Alphaproteobacteria bacterium]
MKQIKGLMLGAMMAVGAAGIGMTGSVADDSVPEPAVNPSLPNGEMIGDIVMPAGSSMDSKESIILGNGANAYGKIVAQMKAKQHLVMAFYKENMPSQGWGLISEIQDDDIILTFQKPTRVAVIQIERGRAVDLTITVTPRN